MSDVINLEDVKKEKEPIEEDGSLKESQVSILEGIFDSTKDIDKNLGGFEGIAALLALPDDQFDIIQNLVLDEMNKSLNNANDKLIMVQALNASGMAAEDLLDLYSEIMNQLEDQLKDQLSQTKIDFVKKMLGLIVNAVADTEGIAKKIIQIPIELCNKNAKIPCYAKSGDSGMDLYAVEDITIKPGETKIIPTGLKVALPFGYELQVRPRSGISNKTKLRVSNSPGTIDSGYRDEIGVIIDNIEPRIVDISYSFDDNGKLVIDSILHGRDFTITKGMRFAQLVLKESPAAAFFQVESVKNEGEPDRGGGFGHTGIS
jgi:dUTP pyrophosphatase